MRPITSFKNTPKVTGFLGRRQQAGADFGGRGEPPSCARCRNGVERPKPSVSFEVGEQVRVADGPFASFNGLGRGSRRGACASEGGGIDFRPGNPVELEYGQVEKL